MRKHIYTEALAPRNTGSIERPARFNLRLTCSARARFHKVLGDLRAGSKMNGAETVEQIMLPLLEALVRDMRQSGMMPGQYLDELRAVEKRSREASRNGGRQMQFEFAV